MKLAVHLVNPILPSGPADLQLPMNHTAVVPVVDGYTHLGSRAALKLDRQAAAR
jgi:hypothetical protein